MKNKHNWKVKRSLKAELADCRQTYNGLAAEVRKCRDMEAAAGKRVAMAANAVSRAYAVVQSGYKEAVETHQSAVSLLLFQEIEPLVRMEQRLKQLAVLLDCEEELA